MFDLCKTFTSFYFTVHQTALTCQTDRVSLTIECRDEDKIINIHHASLRQAQDESCIENLDSSCIAVDVTKKVSERCDDRFSCPVYLSNYLGDVDGYCSEKEEKSPFSLYVTYSCDLVGKLILFCMSF